MKDHRQFIRFLKKFNIPYRLVAEDNPSGDYPMKAIYIGETKFLFNPATEAFEGTVYRNASEIFKERSSTCSKF